MTCTLVYIGLFTFETIVATNYSTSVPEPKLWLIVHSFALLMCSITCLIVILKYTFCRTQQSNFRVQDMFSECPFALKFIIVLGVVVENGLFLFGWFYIVSSKVGVTSSINITICLNTIKLITILILYILTS